MKKKFNWSAFYSPRLLRAVHELDQQNPEPSPDWKRVEATYMDDGKTYRATGWMRRQEEQSVEIDVITTSPRQDGK